MRLSHTRSHRRLSLARCSRSLPRSLSLPRRLATHARAPSRTRVPCAIHAPFVDPSSNLSNPHPGAAAAVRAAMSDQRRIHANPAMKQRNRRGNTRCVERRRRSAWFSNETRAKSSGFLKDSSQHSAIEPTPVTRSRGTESRHLRSERCASGRCRVAAGRRRRRREALSD